jgi:poly(A) polymerase
VLNNKLWRKVSRFFRRRNATENGNGDGSALVIERKDHTLSRAQISEHALKVLYRLKSTGHEGFLVGGGVRDLLLHKKPKDFDIATDAKPEQIRKIFRNSRIIGRRFKLVHVFSRNEVVEVSTFRANAEVPHAPVDTVDSDERPAMVKSDNTYGTIEEDAWRRDFTVNALYYNIANFSVIDYTGGMLDLKHRMIRMIGDPEQRFHEDPIRILRAIRLAAKLNFTIHPQTEEPLLRLSGLLQHVPQARLLDEILKLFFEGNAALSYKRLCETKYFAVLFSATDAVLQQGKKSTFARLIKLAIDETDSRFAEEKSLSPAFLIAVILWPVVQSKLQERVTKGDKLFKALSHSIGETISEQSEYCMLPRRMTVMIRSMWMLQYHLERRRINRVFRILHQQYFRAAFDLLLLRGKSGESVKPLGKWWEEFQQVDANERKKMVGELRKK